MRILFTYLVKSQRPITGTHYTVIAKYNNYFKASNWFEIYSTLNSYWCRYFLARAMCIGIIKWTSLELIKQVYICLTIRLENTNAINNVCNVCFTAYTNNTQLVCLGRLYRTKASNMHIFFFNLHVIVCMKTIWMSERLFTHLRFFSPNASNQDAKCWA